MSTRCNIVVKHGKTVTYLYRHYDGYLAETGADILCKLQAARGSVTEFLAAILESRSEPTAYRPVPPRDYQLTTELHGDIEHVYFVAFGTELCLKHAARPKDWSEDSGDWTRAAKRYSLEAFRQRVNADRTEMNTRLAQVKAERPQAYADCQPYEMVPAND